MNKCDEEATEKPFNKKGSDFLVLKDDIHDSISENEGSILKNTAASYNELKAIEKQGHYDGNDLEDHDKSSKEEETDIEDEEY